MVEQSGTAQLAIIAAKLAVWRFSSKRDNDERKKLALQAHKIIEVMNKRVLKGK